MRDPMHDDTDGGATTARPSGDAACEREKRAIRTTVLTARDRLDDDVRRRRSVAICDHLSALPEIVAARVVFCFISFRSEVLTGGFVDACLARGVTVAAPLVTGPHEMVALRVTSPAVDLVTGAWGILEPRAGLPVVDPTTIDAAIVPGSAFDPHGGRAGYGGGFYDTYLGRLRPGVPRIGVCFALQVVERVPCAVHDLAMDVVVTESGAIRCR
jgi:5-formyltetrahydrofolate cyclo-ligase